MGGLLGWGKTRCSSVIIFEKNEYYIGEWANVRIICDNSACKKDVRAFKLKLIREIFARTNMNSTGVVTKQSTEICSIKVPGCKANEKIDRVFQIQIPSIDLKPVMTKFVPLTQEDTILLNSFTCSVSAKLF